MSSDYAFSAHPHPPTGGSALSPRRRDHHLQPPALRTSVSALQQHAPHLVAQTPVSANSMSSPYSSYNPATFTHSPSILSSQYASPIAPRTASGLFNPQQWGSPAAVSSPVVGSGYVPYGGYSGPTMLARPSLGTEGLEAVSPPPPYSPRRSNHDQSGQHQSSSPTSASQNLPQQPNASQYSPPTNSASTMSPVTPASYRPTVNHERSPHPAPAPYFPPPPPTSSERRTRSSSKQRSDRPQPLFSLSALTGRKTSASPAPSATASRAPVPQQQIQPESYTRLNTTASSSSSSNVPELNRLYTATRRHGDRFMNPAPDPSNSYPITPIAQTPVAGEGQGAESLPPPLPGPPPGPPPVTIATDIPRPPAARRAASTGVIGSPIDARSRTASPDEQGWTPGMPLPPPPRAPPPNARSQSMTRTPTEGSSSSSRSFSNPNATTMPTRRPLAQGSSLPAVPPTPADWVHEDLPHRNRPSNSAGKGLHIDTSQGSSARASSAGQDADFTVSAAPALESHHEPSESQEDSSARRLGRTRAVRDPSVKGIRERRTESRNGKGRAIETFSPTEPSNNPWAESMDMEPLVLPTDIVIPATGSGLQRRRTITKSTPRSAHTPGSAVSMDSSGQPASEHSRQTTPRPGSAHRVDIQVPSPRTPPLSPDRQGSGFQAEDKVTSNILPPKALPTPPPQSGSLSANASSFGISTQEKKRPVSHLLHIPNPNSVIPPPLSPAHTSSRPPSRPPSRQSRQSRQSSFDTQATTSDADADAFARAAIERHNAFTQREATAKTDRERVELFAEFIVKESRLRRERYAGAMDSMGTEILELTRDLFKPFAGGRRHATLSPSSSSGSDWPADSPQSPQRSAYHQNSLTSVVHGSSNSSPEVTSNVPDSPRSLASNGTGRPENGWWGGYMPSLSPIPSMSVSDMPDEMSSRGRPSSRWWEASQEGSIYSGGVRGLERSKRESKYMGVPREARESLQWEGNGRPSSSSSGNGSGRTASGPSNQNLGYGPNEYPPEKAGWHEESGPVQVPHCLPSAGLSVTSSYSPRSPYFDPNKLDVSRLITLPPPHPRHHPAVNNSHPDLTAIRTVVRTLGDFSEIKETKDKYNALTEQLQEEAQQESRKRNSLMRGDIHRMIEAGSMSFSEAARVEADFLAEENEKKRQRAQADFDRFQKEVVQVLNSLLLERIASATASFEQLRSQLFVDAQERSPNLTQEEGDEQPELLEKLTLLKWIFEAREGLHRELYDLLTERNDKYKVMVITPYQLAGKEDKIREAEAFFQKDGQDRKVQFEKEVLKRVEEFMDVVEQNVVRGVEVQLSAFWDIAPALLEVMEKIPNDLVNSGFGIQIPAAEYEENPSYYEFPLQYLYSLLCHSEKSSYQFIESQTNLLCLLHEVKSAVTSANCHLVETERTLSGEDFATVDAEMKEARRGEEKRLTDDLKEKVRTVEEQWAEALGRKLNDVKDRVAATLMEQGGWDEGSASLT